MAKTKQFLYLGNFLFAVCAWRLLIYRLEHQNETDVCEFLGCDKQLLLPLFLDSFSGFHIFFFFAENYTLHFAYTSAHFSHKVPRYLCCFKLVKLRSYKVLI